MSCKSQQNEIKYEVIKTDNEWREQLDQMSYLVLRKAYTERPYTGKYDNFYEKGTYHCAGCDEPLYKSSNKYNSFVDGLALTRKLAINWFTMLIIN